MARLQPTDIRTHTNKKRFLCFRFALLRELLGTSKWMRVVWFLHFTLAIVSAKPFAPATATETATATAMSTTTLSLPNWSRIQFVIIKCSRRNDHHHHHWHCVFHPLLRAICASTNRSVARMRFALSFRCCVAFVVEEARTLCACERPTKELHQRDRKSLQESESLV